MGDARHLDKVLFALRIPQLAVFSGDSSYTPFVKPPVGLEPTISGLQGRCLTISATAARVRACQPCSLLAIPDVVAWGNDVLLPAHRIHLVSPVSLRRRVASA